MNRTRLRYWGYRYPVYLGALITLILLGLNGYRHLTQRDMGIIIVAEGRILYADGRTGLQTGDVVLSIEGEALSDTLWPYYHETFNPPRDTLTVEVERANQRFTQPVPFDQPAPSLVQLFHFPLVVVALVYWGYGVWVITYHERAQRDTALVFFVFTQLMALLLSAGGVVYKDFLGVAQVALTPVLAVATLHLHLLFPHRTTTPRLGLKMGLAYALTITIAILESFPALSVATYQWWVALQAQLPSYLDLSLWFGLSFFAFWSATVVVLLRSFARHKEPGERRQYGIVYISGLLGFLPMLTLSFGPQLLDTLTALPILVFPYELSMLSLVVIPLGYGYAIRRHQLIRLERTVSRATSAFITSLLLILIYWVILVGTRSLTPRDEMGTAAFDLVVVLVLALTFNTVRQRLQHWFDQLLYGGWYDYTTVVSTVSASLQQGFNPQGFAETLSQAVQRAMLVQWVGVLRPDGEQALRGVSLVGDETVLPWFEQLALSKADPVVEWLMEHPSAITRGEMQRRFDLKLVSPDIRLFLRGEHVQLAVPLLGQSERSLMLMGPKFGGEPYGTGDVAIMHVVAQHVSIAFENSQLAQELALRVSESEQYHRRLNEVRDEERKHIARELHDQVIQALVGFKYHLADLESQFDHAAVGAPISDGNMIDLQEQLANLIQVTRDICYDLRPPTLDLGLLPGLRSVIDNFQRASKLQVYFSVEDPHRCGRTVPEPISICLLRCLQESLTNIAKHADATKVEAQLTLTPQWVHLSISDDGRGSELPERLGDLMNDNHFGLLGMRERVELLQGYFAIHSRPAEGTLVTLEVPLTPTPLPRRVSAALVE